MDGNVIEFEGSRYIVRTWLGRDPLVAIEPHNEELVRLLRQVAICSTPLVYLPNCGLFRVLHPKRTSVLADGKYPISEDDKQAAVIVFAPLYELDENSISWLSGERALARTEGLLGS